MLWSAVGGLSGPSRHLLGSLQEKHREQASQLLSTADSAASLRLLVTAKLVTLGYQGFGDSEACSVFVSGRGCYDQLRFGGAVNITIQLSSSYM